MLGAYSAHSALLTDSHVRVTGLPRRPGIVIASASYLTIVKPLNAQQVRIRTLSRDSPSHLSYIQDLGEVMSCLLVLDSRSTWRKSSRVGFVHAFLPHLHHKLPFMPERWIRLASLNDVEVCLREHNRSTCCAHGRSGLLEVALLLVRDFVSSTMSLVTSGTAQSIRTAYVRDALPQSRSHNLEARCRRPLLLALGMQVRMSFVSQDVS